MILPSDNYILLSLINTKLRDEYSSPQELCEEEGLDIDELDSRLAQIGYKYSENTNSYTMRPQLSWIEHEPPTLIRDTVILRKSPYILRFSVDFSRKYHNDKKIYTRIYTLPYQSVAL